MYFEQFYLHAGFAFRSPRTGAPHRSEDISLGQSRSECPARPRERWRLDRGRQREPAILERCGHTIESILIVVTDLDRSPDPYCVLTGGTLFIGDVGRPDLATVV